MKSSPGRARGRVSGSRRRFSPGFRSNRSHGCEWQRGSWTGVALRREEGVLQAEEGDGGTATGACGGACGGAGGGSGGGGRKWAAASRMCTGDSEKRRCGRWSGGGRSGEGEDEQEDEDGAGKKQQHPPPPPPPAPESGGSQGKLQGSGESGDSARLQKVGLEEEWPDEFREGLGGGAPPPAPARSGHDPPAPPPLWQRRLTGVQTREALGRQV